MISVLGIPTDKNSSYMRGASKAPSIILEEFNSEARNQFSENGLNVGKKNIWTNLGNITLEDSDSEFELISNTIQMELKKNNFCISIGGDHSITYPILHGYHNYYPKLNVLHFDAHPDLYENFDNNPYSHASPFARIMENDLAHSLTQIGIRTMNEHQNDQAKRYNVKVITMNEFSSDLKFVFEDPIYISIDLDGIDPAFAPGVSHPEPGGISTRELLKIMSNIQGKIIGADIVEYNPNNDINNITATTAAKLLKELMGKILE